MKRLTFAASFVLLTATAALAQGPSPKQVVASFYKYDRSHSQLVNHRTLSARRQWLSNSLYKLMRAKVDETIEFQETNPDDKPFFGDGFPFQPYAERCDAGGRSYDQTHRIGNAAIRGNTAWVDVTFAYPKACPVDPSVYKIKLIRSRGAWRIDDVVYPGGSSLVADMKAHSY